MSRIYDFLLRLYVLGTLPSKPQKYTTLKAPEPQPVKMPSLVSAVVIVLAIMGAALLGVDGIREVRKP